jgi:hypothetical protein
MRESCEMKKRGSSVDFEMGTLPGRTWACAKIDWR